VKALHSKELAGRLQAEGSEVGGIPPAEFGAYIKSEIAKWKRVVKEAGIKAE
jgi:tripartite-type tricarboxylate transporter receptor subunit TctC